MRAILLLDFLLLSRKIGSSKNQKEAKNSYVGSAGIPRTSHPSNLEP